MPELLPDDLRTIIGRMDAKLDILVNHSADHEARLRSLEVFKNRLLGYILAAGSIGAVLSEFLNDSLRRLFSP